MVKDEHLKALRSDLRYMKYNVRKIVQLLELYVAIGELDTPEAEYFRHLIGKEMNDRMNEFIEFKWKAQRNGNYSCNDYIRVGLYVGVLYANEMIMTKLTDLLSTYYDTERARSKYRE